jgi:hypothetical protein
LNIEINLLAGLAHAWRISNAVLLALKDAMQPFGKWLALIPKVRIRTREEMIGQRPSRRDILHDDFDHPPATVEERASQRIFDAAFVRGFSKLVIPVEELRHGNFGLLCRHLGCLLSVDIPAALAVNTAIPSAALARPSHSAVLAPGLTPPVDVGASSASVLP